MSNTRTLKRTVLRNNKKLASKKKGQHGKQSLPGKLSAIMRDMLKREKEKAKEEKRHA